MMNRLALWLDNPILVKHARSRLRPMQVVPAVSIVMILALSIVLIGYQYDRMAGGGTFGWLMALQGMILAIVGAGQIGSSVGKARESGILDFHRASPMTPVAEVTGFFFGAPILEYALFAATLPFSLICVYMGWPSPKGFFQLMVPMVLIAWNLHAISLLNALTAKGGKAGFRGLIGLVIFLVLGGFLSSGVIRTVSLIDETPTLGFFWFDLPWLATLAVDMLPPIGFFLVASTRKMASERAHVLSKPQAIAGLATGAFLLVGGLWSFHMPGSWTLVSLYALIIGAIVLIVTVTPSRDEFVKGIRKAAKEGRKYPSVWSDRGLNRIAVFCMCGVVLMAPTVVWQMIEAVPEPMMQGFPGYQMIPPSYSLPIAIGVLVVAYFGLSIQYFLLRFGKQGPILAALFLLAAWLLPLICGAFAFASAARNRVPGMGPDVWSPAIASLSPIFGITVSSGIGDVPGHQLSRAAALLPALVFALLFNNLVTRVRRRIEQEVHPGPASRAAHESKAVSDELAEPVASA